MDKAQEGDVTFLSNPKYAKHLSECKATVVMVKAEHKDQCAGNALVVADPYVAFARVVQAMDTTPKPAEDIAPSAVIASDVKMGENVAIGANAVIETGLNWVITLLSAQVALSVKTRSWGTTPSFGLM